MATQSLPGKLDDPFLDVLLTYESGINPLLGAHYAISFDKPCVNYWKVRRPGVLLRDVSTGVPIPELVSYAEYFHRIGCPLSCDHLTYKELCIARYQAINPWGFVGFQIGEAILIDAGFYVAEEVSHDGALLPAYYTGDVPESAWAGGAIEKIHVPSGSGQAILATDHNRWRGSFTGKMGLHDFDDLRNPHTQTAVMKELVRTNIRQLEQLLTEASLSPNDVARAAATTVAGCAASCHLAGVQATFLLLTKDQDSIDETGTPASSYLRHFCTLPIGDWLEQKSWRCPPQ
jgi:hypothetical protein